MPTESVQIALISAISGVLVAYIVNVMAKRVQQKKADKQPKDRLEQMFDGYERLIKQKDTEDDRKVKAIQILEDELSFTRKTVLRLEEALAETKNELLKSRRDNKELRALLDELRKEYNIHKEQVELIDDKTDKR